MFELLFNFLPPIFEDSNPVVQSKLYIFGLKFFLPSQVFLLMVKTKGLILTQLLHNWFKLAKCIQSTLTTVLTYLLNYWLNTFLLKWIISDLNDETAWLFYYPKGNLPTDTPWTPGGQPCQGKDVLKPDLRLKIKGRRSGPSPWRTCSGR